MLVHIAEKLECPAATLLGETEFGITTPSNDLLDGLLMPGALDLLRAYNAISVPRQKKAVLKLINEIAGLNDDDEVQVA